MGKRRQPDVSRSVLPPAVTEALVDSLWRIEPSPSRRVALRSAVLDRARADDARSVTVRAADGTWMPLAPKVAYRMLEDDGAMQAFLLRLDPGASLPGHDHPGDELCLVLAGSLAIGDLAIAAGDYHVAMAGSEHDGARSESGALLFIRTVSGVIPHAPMR